jgi:hypothetical protein
MADGEKEVINQKLVWNYSKNLNLAFIKINSILPNCSIWIRINLFISKVLFKNKFHGIRLSYFYWFDFNVDDGPRLECKVAEVAKSYFNNGLAARMITIRFEMVELNFLYELESISPALSYPASVKKVNN